MSFSCNLLCIQFRAVHCRYRSPISLVLVNDSEALVDFILVLNVASPFDARDHNGQRHVLIDRQLETFVIVEVVSRRGFEVVRRHYETVKLVDCLHCDTCDNQNSDQAAAECLKLRIAFVCQ